MFGCIKVDHKHHIVADLGNGPVLSVSVFF